MELKTFILILLVCIILYLIYNIKGDLEEVSKKSPTVETFQTSIIDKIDELYDIYDIDTMRNLAQITKTILNDDNFILPAATTRVNNIIIDENIKFSQSMKLNYLLPRYSVIGWYNTKSSIPSGWAVCDGQRYALDNNGNAKINPLGTLTPDLRGRFILGAGIGKDNNNKDLKERIWKDMGGEDVHQLTLEELPAHSHDIMELRTNNWYYGYILAPGQELTYRPYGTTITYLNETQISAGFTMNTFFQSELNKITDGINSVEIYKKGGKLRPGTGNIVSDFPDLKKGDTKNPGIYDVQPHENMPPFLVIIYIMKL